MLRRACSSLLDLPQPAPGIDWPASTSAEISGYMLGPNILELSWPVTAWIESRTSSALSRRISNRQRRLFVGSLAKPSVLPADDMR
jgi:hypothetical protein